MTKEWIKVLAASAFELIWVTGLAHAETTVQWIFTGIGVVASFVLLTLAAKKIPIGTVYAVFAGLGSVGTILTGAIFFGEKVSLVKLFFMGTLILGIIGLKLIETKPSETLNKVKEEN